MNVLGANSRSTLLVLIASYLFLLAGCAMQLAPPYDKVVVEGLNTVNTEAMTLFATAASGTKAAEFGGRADRYSTLIGKLDSLAILAGARPVPKNKVGDVINKYLVGRESKPIVEDDATPPSAHAIKKISEALSRMRETDKQRDMTATEIKAFQTTATIYFDQAITYENFLQR